MTNPGLPPVLSRTHHQRVAERAEALRVDLEALLADVDAALAEVQGAPVLNARPAAFPQDSAAA